MFVRSSAYIVRLLASAVSTASVAFAPVAASVVLSATSAYAQTPARTTNATLPTGGHAPDLFIPAWDENGDGKVPRAEYDVVRAERFRLADEDGSGALNADEYIDEYAIRLDRQMADERKASIDQTHTRFRALDRDKGSSVSRAEYDASGEHVFARLDHDKDGRIAKADPDAGAVEATKSGDATRAESSRPRPRLVIAMPTTHTRAGFVQMYDGDADDVVTRAQYDSQRTAAFTATDVNRDGKLDEAEYVNEFVERLDRQIARVRQAQLQQGQVRFESIDRDKNGAMSREEYFSMSAGTFMRADTNSDGVVSQDDPPPARNERDQENVTDRS